MAVSLPIAGFSELDVLPDLGVTSLRTEGGLIVTSRSTDPYFAGTITTGELSQSEYADLRAFLIDCVDRNLRVDFLHPRQLVPRSYTIANLPFAGTATIASFTDLRTPVLAGLSIGLELKRGDRLTFEEGDMRCCRWMRSDVTVSSATVQSLSITPRLPIGVFTIAAVVQFKNPVLRLMIVPGSFSMPETYSQTPISFDVSEALQ